MKTSSHVSPNLQTSLIILYYITTPKCITDDNSRVVLDPINNEEYSDYINASYIDVCCKTFQCIIVIVSLRLMFLIVQGYNRSNAYIAAQGKLYSSKHYFY